jgi:hypothetical protein
VRDGLDDLVDEVVQQVTGSGDRLDGHPGAASPQRVGAER